MVIDPAPLVLALVLFQAKHFAADFLLQPGYIWKNKGTYGHPGGVAHALIHMVGSVPALVALGMAPAAVLGAILVEGVVHYHIDWTKERLNRTLALTSTQARFWHLFGADQAAHQLTYIGLLWAGIALAPGSASAF